MLAEHQHEVDAAVIAAFGDPALGGARELFDIPIVGMTEAALLTACMLGRNYSIVTFSPGLVSWYRECVEWHGLERRCASIRALDTSFAALSDVQDEHRARLVALANQTAAEDGADVIVFSGAPLAGLAAKVCDRIAVPVVDPAAAALKLRSRRWSRSCRARPRRARSAVQPPRLQPTWRGRWRAGSPGNSGQMHAIPTS